MTPRHYVGAWLVALILAGTAVIAARGVSPRQHPFFDHVQIAVIGSSLLKSAIAPSGSGATSLLGDGSAHQRVGVNSVEEWQVIALANQALDNNVRVLFVEVNPFIRDLPDSGNEHVCDAHQAALRHWFKDRQFTLANDFHSAVGLKRLERRGDDEPPLLHQEQKFTREEIKAMYPLVLHKPFCGRQFAQVVQTARRRGVTVVLILPPNSAASEAIQGKPAINRQRALARQTAADFGLPLFEPHSPWGDAEFYDLAHFNIKGRAHFQAELAAWWRSR